MLGGNQRAGRKVKSYWARIQGRIEAQEVILVFGTALPPEGCLLSLEAVTEILSSARKT